jgi:hypothetical protein
MPQNRVERVNVGVMMAGQGRVADVFAATAAFVKERKRKEEEALRAKKRYSPAQQEARRCALVPRVCARGSVVWVWGVCRPGPAAGGVGVGVGKHACGLLVGGGRGSAGRIRHKHTPAF